MRTEHCKRAVFTALSPVQGIRSAEVRLGAVIIDHEDDVDIAALRDAIEVTGYVVVDVAFERRVLPVVNPTELDDKGPGATG